MKVLLINKFYYLSGGAERYVFDWQDLLRARGHDVAVFAMRHPRNRPCAEERFFVEPVRFATDLPLNEKVRAAARSLWSRDARRKIRALIETVGTPDVIHLNSYLFQLTASILGPLAESGAPIVLSCHDYAPVCVNQHLYSHRTETRCEDCLRYGPLSPLRRRCIKGSSAASATGCMAGFIDRFIGRSRQRAVRFVAYSAFVRQKLIEGGLPADRIVCIPYFVNAERIEPGEGPGDYMLFFGRLVPQKGVRTFLDAAALRRDIPCKLLGGGVMEEEVRSEIARRNLTNVECLGHLEGGSLQRVVRGARAVVAPSEWYEPFGLVIVEGMAAGRPAIASRLAGPAEIVSDGEDGLLVPPGDAAALAEAMATLWTDPERARAMGRKGREKVLRDYSPERHYSRMMDLFEISKERNAGASGRRTAAAAGILTDSVPMEIADMTMPVDAVLAVTWRCNARCDMCGIWKTPAGTELPPGAYGRLPPTLRDVNLTGGEPFLRDDLPALHEALRRACPRARTVVSTNGLLRERVVAAAREMTKAEPDLGIAISLDGPPDAHDALRGVPGAHEKATGTLKALQDAGLRNLRLAFTATPANAAHLSATCELAARLGVQFTCAVVHSSEHYFHTYGPAQRPSLEELRRQFEIVMRRELATFSPKRWARAYFMDGLYAFASGRGRPLPCRAGRDYFFMDPAGNLFTCNAAPFGMGNLAERSFDDIWNSPEADGARRRAAGCPHGCWMICTARTAIRRAGPRVLAWAAARKLFGLSLPEAAP